MIESLPLLDEATIASPDNGNGCFGALSTSSGYLPLKAMNIEGRIDGLLSQVTLSQTFANVTDVPLEATYIFPMPDRAAVTGYVMEVAGRKIEGKLEERGKARSFYETAQQAGRRVSIAEEERPDAFTLRVGNLMPNEEAVIRFTLASVLPYQDGEVTFRFPLVVAERYIPGKALPGASVGDGVADDTDAVPDASRISPPVLLPGYPNPVHLSLSIDLYGWRSVAHGVRSSLHAIATEESDDVCRIRLQPGAKLDRDFILRFKLGGKAVSSSLTFHPDSPNGGTFALTVIPPDFTELGRPKPRDVMFVLDRSGSMEGWKIVAARRTMMRMVDALLPTDRLGVLTFAGSVDILDKRDTDCLVAASDRNRFRATEYLAKVEAHGGTEMAPALKYAVHALSKDTPERDRILVLVTDGQVANEDQILRSLEQKLQGVRVFTLGIDHEVNAGFLNRLAECGGGGGSCELVESEDRLDEVMDTIRQRIGSPILTNLAIADDAVEIEPDSLVPSGTTHLFPDVPAVVLGRYLGRTPNVVVVTARDRAGEAWTQQVPATVRTNPAVVAAWARGRLRTLEDRYAMRVEDRESLERMIVDTSLRHAVLCRFTAFVSVDPLQIVNEGGEVLKVTQPVIRSNPSVTGGKNLFIRPGSGGSYGAAPGSAGYGGAGDGAVRGRMGVRPVVANDASGDDDLSISWSSGVGSVDGNSEQPPEAPPTSGGFDHREIHDSYFRRVMRSDPPSTDRFEFVRLISRGGMGEWHMAFDFSRREMVEIRVIPRSVGAVSRHAQWSRLSELTSLEHPGVHSILEVVEEGDRLLLIARRVVLTSLEAILRTQRTLDPQQAAKILSEVADALQYCHAKRLIHGDLTPASILIGAGDSVTLSGFLPEPIQPDQISGTPVYLAPEGWKEDVVSQTRSEVYALGVILYQALTGELPFSGSSATEIMSNAANGKVRAPSTINPAISPDLEQVCLVAMAVNPADRYSSADLFAADLRKILSPDLVEGSRGLFSPGQSNNPKSDKSKNPNPRKGFWKGSSD